MSKSRGSLWSLHSGPLYPKQIRIDQNLVYPLDSGPKGPGLPSCLFAPSHPPSPPKPHIHLLRLQISLLRPHIRTCGPKISPLRPLIHFPIPQICFHWLQISPHQP